MRKIFTLLTLCLLASSAWAVDITFVAGVDNGNSDGTAKAFYIEKEGIRIDVSNGLANATQYRFYKNQTVTVTSSIGAITQIVFECTASGEAQYGPGCFTAAPGDYSFEDKIGTWTGSATPVVFTAVTNQVRATKITVTVGQVGLAAPSINPAAGTYYAPINVNITCATPGAKIYYTTNGSTPTTGSTQYSAPFTVNTNTTVKAISAKDGDVSDVVEAAYEFATATPVASIAEYQNVPDETVVIFTNPVNVLVQSGSRMFVQDGTGRALFYGNCGQTYNNGDVIPAGFVGTKVMYDGEPELKDLTNFMPASGNSPIDPTTITTAQVNAGRFAQLVYLEGVTFNKTDKLVIDAAGEAPYYCNLNVKDNDIVEGTTYNLTAIVGSHGRENPVYQLLPVSIKRPGDGFGWGNMGETPDNTTVTFDFESTIIWQSGRYLYAMDETGFGLAYGDVGQTYKFGDVIPSGFGGKKTTYKGEPELAAIENGQPLPGFQPKTKNVKPTPEVITPEQVNHDHWAHYVLLKNVMINADGTIITATNGATCEMYNKTFNIALPEDLNVPHNIYGVVGVFNNYQVLPISFDVEPGDYVEPEPVAVANINELYALNGGDKGKFTTALTTIYQNGPNLYVKDVTGNYSLVYGTVADTFVNGDFINNAVASWTTYQNNKQMVPEGDTFVKAGHGAPVQPEIMPIEEVSQDMVHWYIGLENVAVAQEGDDYFVTDETGSIKLFDKFKVITDGTDLSKVTYTEGFLTVYRGELEFYPIKFGGGVVGDVNGDGEVSIADVNALIDMILSGTLEKVGDVNGDGEVSIADINAVIDIILGK